MQELREGVPGNAYYQNAAPGILSTLQKILGVPTEDSVLEGRKVNRECHFISLALTSDSHFLLWGNLLPMVFKQLVETLLHLQPRGLQAFGKSVQCDPS